MKIGIIGGSFDPFHLGHKRIINETISKLNLDKMHPHYVSIIYVFHLS